MKIACGSLDFALARVQARHGQRLTEADWRGIEGLRGFAPALEQARSTALRPWLDGITGDSPPAQVEAVLRGHWRALVDELAGWMPPHWQPALAWCASLPDLPALQHLARGGEPAAWMQADPRWAALCEAPAEARAAALDASPWAALAPAWQAPDGLGEAWLAEWQRRAGADGGGGADGAQQRLMALLHDHARAFGPAAPGQGWLLRAALRARLALLLRAAALQPAAAFIHLAICALDLERLRGELLRRAWFPRWRLA